jgi:hypothetical protein
MSEINDNTQIDDGQQDLFADIFTDSGQQDNGDGDNGDHFTDIYTDDTNTGDGGQQQQSQQSVVNTNTEDPKYKALQDELESYRAYMPIARYLQENPQSLTILQEQLTNTAKQQEAPKLEKPQRPAKPSNYDALDDNPESESYKYRLAMEEYPVKLAEYTEAIYNEKQDKIEAILQQQEAERQQIEQLKSIYGEVTSKHGLNAQEAQEFLKFIKDPNSVTTDKLVQLFKLTKAPSNGAAQTQKKINEFQKRTERTASPLPAGVQPGQSAPQYDENDQFNIGLLRQGNRTKYGRY